VPAAAGRGVAPGVYLYRIEGNLYWENTVQWTGRIRIGGTRDATSATPVYSPSEADKQGNLISQVSAVYEPSL